MQLPFTVGQFFAVLEAYNRAIWPGQIAAYVLGILAVVLALRRSAPSDRIISTILAGFWVKQSCGSHLDKSKVKKQKAKWWKSSRRAAIPLF